jgi:hypothetical protein
MKLEIKLPGYPGQDFRIDTGFLPARIHIARPHLSADRLVARRSVRRRACVAPLGYSERQTGQLLQARS